MSGRWKIRLGSGVSPEELMRECEEGGKVRPRKAGGGKREFGRGPKARKKRRQQAAKRGKERRAEELATELQQHLKTVIKRRENREAYRIWLEEVKPGKNIFNEEDVAIETFRSSGPGGQHMQKRETAIRAVHNPTSLSAHCEQERSQAQNRAHALKELREKVGELAQKWRDYESEAGEGSAFQLFEEIAG